MLELWAALGMLIPLMADATELRPGQVEVRLETLHALTPAEEKAPRRAWARHRELELTVQADGILLRGRWTLVAQGAPFFVGELLPARAHVLRATWNGRPASLFQGDTGPVVAGRVTAPVTLEVEAFLPGAKPSEPLTVLEAVTGTVRVSSPTPLRVVTEPFGPALPSGVALPAGTAFTTGAGRFHLEQPTPAAPDTATLALATAGLGVTVGDDAVTTRARVTFTLRRGSLPRLNLVVQGFGEDLDVVGANVASFTRSGDTLTIEQKAPVDTTTVVELTSTTPIAPGAESTLPLPSVTSPDAFRLESTLTLARGGEVDAVPEVEGGVPVAVPELPAWGQGLVTGAPTAAFRLAESASVGRLDLYRYVPVAEPPVRIESADLVFVAAEGGEWLLRARYEVKNARAGVLELRAPRGARAVGAWVAGKDVTLDREGDLLRIPLKRSVETAEGLLSFPVVLVLAAPGDRWERRERRELPLPVVMAPIGVAQVSVRLPRRYHSLLEPGEQGVVSRFSQPVEVAYGLTDEGQVAQADALYADALDAWNANDFERANQRLAELDDLGATSANQLGLQANLTLVGPLAGAPAIAKKSKGGRASKSLGPGESAAPPASADSRRIRAQARARADTRRTTQRAAIDRARKLSNEGDYDAASAAYAAAIGETAALHQLDDEETTTNLYQAAELERELETVEQAKEQREMLESSAKMKLWSGMPFAGGDDGMPLPRRTPPRSAPPLSAPLLSALAPVPLPVGGEEVRYELVLLAPGAERSVPIAARRRRSSR